jgi:protein-disulfide isomerase
MRGPHRLIAGVLFLAIVLVGYFFWFKPHQKFEKPIQISTVSQPTVNSGSGTSLVIFEEPLCPHCLELNLEVMPKIKRKFIDTKKISYTVIPVSFLPHSMSIAEAWLAVYYSQNPPSSERFFTYLNAYYAMQQKRAQGDVHTPWTVNELSNLLGDSLPFVDKNKFIQALHAGTYASEIQKNTSNAEHTLPHGLVTPAIFVDGVRLSQWRHDKLEEAIEKALLRKLSQKERAN